MIQDSAQKAKEVDFVHTGPGTLAGRYLRRFWQPVYLAGKLAAGQSQPIRIMSQDFTLYRGQSGTPYLVAQRCAHRGTQLSTGWVEGETIRCFFHGWRYDHTGQCVEQPAEPAPFCAKIRITAYPTKEYLGFIFVYLGEGEPPPLPRWPELECGTPEAGTLECTMEMLPCNYFQHAENIVDETHLPFTHRDNPVNKGKDIPRISAEESSFGLTAFVHHSDVTLRTEFIMPNQCFLSFYSPPFSAPEKTLESEPSQIVRTLFCYVPIDDESHLHFQLVTWPAGWASAEIATAPCTRPCDEIAAILAGRKHLSELGEHPHLGRIQDGISIAGQGAIADRQKERLGASDVAIILLRKLWSRELLRLAQGAPLTPFGRPDPELLHQQEELLIRAATVATPKD